jgi:nitrogen fixation/metabolism regulation signal transduction histidine kinase
MLVAVLTFAYSVAMLKIQNEFVGLPLAEFATSTEYYLIVTSAYIFFGAIISLCWTSVSSLTKSKNYFKPLTTISIIVLLFLSFIVGGVALTKMAPEYKATYEQWLETKNLPDRT